VVGGKGGFEYAPFLPHTTNDYACMKEVIVLKSRKSNDKRLLVAEEMPPLRRTQPGQPYNYKTDDVLRWISERPGLQGFLFDKLVINGCIYYDPDTGYWVGANYEDD